MKKILRIRRRDMPLKKKQSMEREGEEDEWLKPKSLDHHEMEKSEKATTLSNADSLNPQNITLPLKPAFYFKNELKGKNKKRQVKNGSMKMNSINVEEVFKKKHNETPSFTNTIICQRVWKTSLPEQKQSKLKNRVKSLIQNEYKISINKKGKSLLYMAVEEELGKVFGDKTVYFQKQFTPLNKKTLPSLS